MMDLNRNGIGKIDVLDFCGVIQYLVQAENCGLEHIIDKNMASILFQFVYSFFA